jgi:outer membrane protein assembly factor BamB
VTGAWRHPLHDAGHSGYTTTTDESGETAGETGSAAGPTDTPATAWQHELDDSPTAPVVADGRLYVAAGGQLSCLDATTGDRQWHHDHRGSRSFRVSAVAGTVFVGSETAVTAVAADTGRERWHFAPASDTTLFPVVGSNAVYVTESATISALDRETGSRRWTASLDRGGPLERPAPAGNTVYVSDSASAGRLLAFDTADGTVRWETDGVGSHPTAVTVHDGRVFLGEFYGSVTALTTEGESAWTGQAGPPVGRIVAGPESVYAHGHGGSGDVVVASLDAASGDQQWTRATGYPLAATTDRVYLAEASQTTAAAADTGEPQWTVDTSGSRAAVTDDSLFLSTDTGVRALTTTA